jgi:hypothetical protein
MSCHCPEFKDCSFRIYDLKMKIPICNFISATMGVQTSRKQYYINRACRWIKTEESRLASIRKNARKMSLEFLKNAQIGETVYCFYGSPYDLEVTLLEKPSDRKITSRCKVQRKSGKIFSVYIHLLRTFSKGNYSADYFVGGIRAKKRAQNLQYKAKIYGFRAEIEKKEDGYLLKIFGDSQLEVDDFVNLFIKQNLELVI